MIDIHPTLTAGDGKPFRDSRYRSPNEDSETLFISCPHCGYRNKTNRDALPPPYPSGDDDGGGISYVSVNVVIPAGTKTVIEPQRLSGCIFCGHNYKESSYRKPFYSKINLQRG